MLRRRLYLRLLPLLLLVVAMGAYAIGICGQLAGLVQRDMLANFEDSQACERMRAVAARMGGAADVARRGDRLAAVQILERGRDAFERELMGQSMKNRGDPRSQYVHVLDDAFARFLAVETGLVDAAGGGAAVREGEAALAGVGDAVDRLEDYDYRAAQAAEAKAERLYGSTVRVLLVAMGAAFLLALWLAWRLAAFLLAPIGALTASAVALGDGDLERTVPEVSPDELGRLARAFNTMAAKLRAYRDAATAKVVRAQRTVQATVTSTPDPLFIVDREGRHELRNPAAEILSASPALADGFPGPLEKALRDVLATGAHFLPADYDHVLTLRVEREDRHYLPRILAIGDTLTGFDGAAVFLQDVTRFRLLDDAKNNLVGTVSHELKTPLTSLRMAVYLLLEQGQGDLTAQQRELLETARDDADRLMGILNDLLDLTRLEAGVAQLNRVEVPVEELLTDMAREIKPLTDSHGQTVAIERARGCVRVLADRASIRHVFINLLANASKYSPRGSVITLYARPAEDGFVRFGVRDQGPGIPAESLGRIFEKFYRLPGQARAGGAGLGLTIAREIVLAHGGFIACASRPGEGSDFHFHLPGNSSAAPATM